MIIDGNKINNDKINNNTTDNNNNDDNDPAVGEVYLAHHLEDFLERTAARLARFHIGIWL